MNNFDNASIMALGGSMLFFIVILMFWSLFWKGIALWKAARNGSKGWYIVLLVFNTAGILEILYIYLFSKKEAVVKPAESAK